ncbi:hypothetical protein BMT54_07375 [Pasteurellaceae bacterium 15-036681]|nr:hypothetical protein BMT54_07375 [Pasteurellaceae bacterium 15-036681]
MNWLDWLKIGLGIFVLLCIVGYFADRKETAKRKRLEEMKEEEYFRDALKKNICPQCGTKGSLQELEDERVRSPYTFKGLVTKFDRKAKVDRRMETWERKFEDALRCTQCDYHKVYRREVDYNVKVIADGGYDCPKCGKIDSVYLKGVIAKECYTSNKEVEEKNSRGTKKRYIKVTKSLEEETYGCRNCDFHSVATVTKELD